jgi:tetratricopeptide (TPR) repeat protein
MKGFRGLFIALILTALLVPVTAAAQQRPRDSKYTKDAAKFIGLAMMRPDPAEQAKLFQDALNALTEGFEKDAQNPKLWFVAGQTYAGLGQIDKAGEAFNKALELYPEYAPEIEGERESAWMSGFQRGVELMDQQKNDEALAVFEASNALWPHRPEAWMNIGSIYANKGDIEKAVAAFEKAIEATKGPMLEKLDSAGKAQWKNYAEVSSVNIGQMLGAQGVEKFEAGLAATDATASIGHYKDAESLFRRASEVNPHSRDFLFNIVQSRYAQASKLEEQIEATPASQAQLAPQLIQMYETLPPDIRKVLSYDPNNEDLYMIMARAAKRRGELAGDTTAAQQGALAILTEREEKLSVEVANLSIVPNADNTGAEIKGTLKNRKLATGADVTIKLTLLDRTGATIGEQQITVKAPAPNETFDFTATSPITGQIAGWKYQVS